MKYCSPETNFNTIQELLVPRLGTEPSTWSRGRLGTSHQQQLLRRQQQVSEIKSQLTDTIWPKRFCSVLIYQIAIRQETSQPAFAIYVCSPWRAYLQKIQVTSGEALDTSHVDKGRLFTWNLQQLSYLSRRLKKLFHQVLVTNLYSGKGFYFFLLRS